MRKAAVMTCLLLCSGCENKQQGTITDYHLQEHTVQITDAKQVAVIADCRGNDRLSWEVLDSQAFPQPAKVGVFCGMYLQPPAAEEFTGWGSIKANWPESQFCEHATASKHGEESCSDYLRALRDSAPASAPWCQISFAYDAPVTVKLRLVTYCK